MNIGIKHVDHVNLTVSDLEDSVRWYRDALEFQVVERGVRSGVAWAIVRSGDAMLALYEAKGRHVGSAEENARLSLHAMAHFGLRTSNKAALLARLQAHGVHIDHEARYPHSHSIYLRDPSGHEVELACWDDDTIRFDT